MKAISTLLLLFLPLAATAEIYKWVDESGRVHYSDKPAKGAKTETLNININSYESVTVNDFSTTSSSNSVAGKLQKVIMYSTQWCGYCKKAKKYFTQKGIPFVEYDIEKNAKAKREYDALGGRGVPVILVGKKRMNGFSIASFDRIYQK